MKTITHYLALAALLISFAGCSSAYKTTGSNYDDDVYYSPSQVSYDQTTEQGNSKSSESGYSQENQSSGSQGTTYNNTTNNYYNDDYYDYSYSARVRRFYRPVYSYDYYDPYYTNYYWYNHNPMMYGTSIYMGYSWWWPSPLSMVAFAGSWYNPWWGMSWGWGTPYYSCGYYGASYYNPYFWGWHSNFNNGYYNGYNNGFYNGYYNGLYASGNYYNSYDANSNYYYGHRNTTSSNTPMRSTLGETYANAVGEKAFNSKFTKIEPAGVSRVPAVTEQKGGGRTIQPAAVPVQPGKTASGAVPERGNQPDVSKYSEPNRPGSGLDQKGINNPERVPPAGAVTNYPPHENQPVSRPNEVGYGKYSAPVEPQSPNIINRPNSPAPATPRQDGNRWNNNNRIENVAPERYNQPAQPVVPDNYAPSAPNRGGGGFSTPPRSSVPENHYRGNDAPRNNPSSGGNHGNMSNFGGGSPSGNFGGGHSGGGAASPAPAPSSGGGRSGGGFSSPPRR